MFDSLRPHGQQHTRPPCPSPTPGVYPNSCLLSRWCPSSVVPFSSFLPSFPASGSFPMSQPFTSGGQSIGASSSASVLPKNIQDWSPLGWTDWISLQSKGLTLKSLLQHHSSKASILPCSASFMVQLLQPNWKIYSFGYTDIFRQINVFLICYICHSFASKEQASFNFMAAITICSDFGAPKK